MLGLAPPTARSLCQQLEDSGVSGESGATALGLVEGAWLPNTESVCKYTE